MDQMLKLRIEKAAGNMRDTDAVRVIVGDLRELLRIAEEGAYDCERAEDLEAKIESLEDDLKALSDEIALLEEAIR